MKKIINFEEHSKTSWHKVNEPDKYPGDKEMIIGCLQRIANSLEIFSGDIMGLINQRDFYKDEMKYYKKRASAYKGLVKGKKRR